MLQGAYTAIVTPFRADGSVDYEKLRALVDMQARAGIDGIVPVGTTGESPTLNYDEHRKVIMVAAEAARGRMKVIAGTGANSTAEAIELTQYAIEAGADATLQVAPYYNRPNAEGIHRHFMAIADLGLPVVLYNVPGRTGKDITADMVVRLAKHPRIVAVKEAGGNVDRVSQILARCNITVFSGDDALTLPMMSVGAKGVISVASNVAPDMVANMVHHALDGQWEEARALHFKLHRLFTDLFIDSNPIPVKAAMSMMGLIEEAYRLPLCNMPDNLKQTLRETLKATGLLQA
jgi:4-hydroxy-tetrahydrodipicolinate synthase